MKIEIIHYDDGGDYYGTRTKVDGEELELHNSDTGTIVRQLLEHLGHEVEVTEIYE